MYVKFGPNKDSCKALNLKTCFPIFVLYHHQFLYRTLHQLIPFLYRTITNFRIVLNTWFKTALNVRSNSDSEKIYSKNPKVISEDALENTKSGIFQPSP